MVIGILQFEVLIHGAESIKDKRRVVSSLKDRLRREFHVSVAEVGLLDNMHAARMGLALVGNEGRHIGQMLDRITASIRAMHGAELGECAREILSDPVGGAEAPGPAEDFKCGHDEALAREMLRRAAEAAQ